MSFNLVTILIGQSHISNVRALSQISKCTLHIVLEVISLKEKLLWHCQKLVGTKKKVGTSEPPTPQLGQNTKFFSQNVRMKAPLTLVRFPNCHECQLGFQYP